MNPVNDETAREFCRLLALARKHARRMEEIQDEIYRRLGMTADDDPGMFLFEAIAMDRGQAAEEVLHAIVLRAEPPPPPPPADDDGDDTGPAPINPQRIAAGDPTPTVPTFPAKDGDHPKEALCDHRP